MSGKNHEPSYTIDGNVYAMALWKLLLKMLNKNISCD